MRLINQKVNRRMKNPRRQRLSHLCSEKQLFNGEQLFPKGQKNTQSTHPVFFLIIVGIKSSLLVWSVQHPRRSAVSGTPLLCWTINFIKDISKRHFRTISKLSIFFSLWCSAWFCPLLWVCNRFSLESELLFLSLELVLFSVSNIWPLVGIGVRFIFRFHFSLESELVLLPFLIFDLSLELAGFTSTSISRGNGWILLPFLIFDLQQVLVGSNLHTRRDSQ